MPDINLQCQCGKLSGKALNVSPGTGNYVVCYCRSCQQFLNELDKAELMDKEGGSHIFQLSPNRVQITAGQEQLRCTKLTPKGPLRWYATCCNSPVANTFSASMPVVGLATSLITDEQQRKNLGEVEFYVQGQYAKSQPPHPVVHEKFPSKLIRRILRQAFLGKLLARHKPSPFYNNGSPVHEPKQITKHQ